MKDGIAQCPQMEFLKNTAKYVDNNMTIVYHDVL
jgi:hypothetical protein